jgi:hypothetical protein
MLGYEYCSNPVYRLARIHYRHLRTAAGGRPTATPEQHSVVLTVG